MKFEDYEKIILSQPNSSLAWIKYITFYIDKFDIAAARGIAERALNTISFREETVRNQSLISLVEI
jgi:rRNA biogenesis protein RRP5